MVRDAHGWSGMVRDGEGLRCEKYVPQHRWIELAFSTEPMRNHFPNDISRRIVGDWLTTKPSTRVGKAHTHVDNSSEMV